jgi:hypothetical protein
MTKPLEKEEARRLRQEQGMPIKRIAARLRVSPSSVLRWTSDIELTEGQLRRNNERERLNRESFGARARVWSGICRDRRLGWQQEGRRRALKGDGLHLAGCMLYWAEGSKNRNTVILANSDVHMMRFFRGFLTECFGLGPSDLSVRLNVYTGNGLSVRAIENYWLGALDLPRSCLRKHSINHFPTSSSGNKRNRLPYGVCTLRVLRSTRIVQHIFGAIQEYAGFEEPEWVDLPIGKRRDTRPGSLARKQ